jgi:hypothetical protein
MEEFWKDKLIEEGFGGTFDGLTLDKICVSRANGSVTAFFTLDRMPETGLESALRRSLRRVFAGVSVYVRLSCPALGQDFLSDPLRYTSVLTDMVALRKPAMGSQLRGAAWEMRRGTLLIVAPSAFSYEFLRGRDCAGVVAALIYERFGVRQAVQVGQADMDPDQMLENLARQRQEQEEKLVAAAMEQVTVKKTKKLDFAQPLFGKFFKNPAMAI